MKHATREARQGANGTLPDLEPKFRGQIGEPCETWARHVESF